MNAPENSPEEEPYEPPELTEHGTVEDLTRAVATGAKDGLDGSGGI